MNKLSIYVIFFLVSIFSIGCQKEGEELDPEVEGNPVEINWSTAEDVVITQTVLNEMIKIIFYNAAQSPHLNIFNSEPSLTIRDCVEERVLPINTNGLFPKIYTLDFGLDCDWYGTTISGSIQIRFSGPLNEENTSFEITTLNGFKVNDQVIEMQDNGLMIFFVRSVSNGLKEYEMSSNNIFLTNSDGKLIEVGLTWSTIKLDEMETTFEQYGEDAFLDDQIEIIVLESNLETEDLSFKTKTITGFPLKYEEGCRWIKSGQMQIDELLTIDDPMVATKLLDFAYENEECDNLILSTVGEESKILESP